VNGTNFVPGAVVNFNGKAEASSFVSATQLTATVSAADNATGGAVAITVTNPAPGGGTSNEQTFTVDSFTIGGPAGAVTVSAGQPAQFAITLTPSANGFSNPLTFSATGLPAATTVSFSPNPATPGSAATMVTMTVTTTARSSASPRELPIWPASKPAMLAILDGLLALAAIVFLRWRRTSHGWARALPLAALLVCLALTVGCASGGGGGSSNNSGGGSSSAGTPAGTSQINVTATSGTLVQTTQVTLTVN